MRLIYMDDSHDQDTGVYAFSALAVPADLWSDLFSKVQAFRHALSDSDGIFVTKELHAWKFVSGRGRISNGVVTKARRCKIFRDSLAHLGQQNGISLFNSVNKSQNLAFERLLNRVNTTMRTQNDHALLICAEGKEGVYRRLGRKRGV